MTPRYAESLNRALHRLMAENPRVFLIGEDVLDPYGGAFKVARDLSTAFPDRVLTTPISEAAIVGVGIGLALSGFRPIVEIMFGDFLTLATDQIVNHAAKFRWMYNEQVRVPIVIRTPMGGRRGYGPTHSQTLEQLFFSVPGLRIVAPSHLHDAGELLRTTVLTAEDPTLFVENKLLYGERLLLPDDHGRIGDFVVEWIAVSNPHWPTIRLSVAPAEPADAVLICYGGMAPLAMEAAHAAFMKNELKVTVLVASQVKPLPFADVAPCVRECGRVVFAEEGHCASGWGSGFANQLYAAMFRDLRAPIQCVGAQDLPIPSSRPMEDKVLPQVADIENALNRVMNE